MRLVTYPLLLSLAGVSAALVVGACSDDVATTGDTGSGGSGATSTTSAGGSTSTDTVTATTTTSTTTTTAATTSSTSGAGGGTLCDQACSKIANECGVDGCSFLQIDCSGNQYDCFAQCILDATCDQILSLAGGSPDPALAACLQPCQGGSGAGGASGAGGGGNGNDCQTCATQQCFSEASACFQDAACQPFIQCAQACQDSACVDDCLTQYPGGQALADCTCQNCADSCTQCQ